MSLITTVDLGKTYGPVDIFTQISLSIPPRARIGLVGQNGVGKTTLLRILAGLEEPSAGVVQRARGLRIGYLPQGAALDSQHTLWQECQLVFSDLLARQEELNRLAAAMSDPGQTEAALAAYGRLQEEFEHLGGYTYETRIRQTLSGLGFSPADERRPVTQLSGGQRTRALLARLLLSDPGLLLLDEPTNHLDLESIEWLESYLRDLEAGVVVVSHDRYFLDQVVDTIWEMTPVIELYRGNYSAYLQQRSERYQRRLEEYQAQQAFIEKEEDYIRRNIAGQNTRQAQGRRKRLERLLEESRLTPPSQQRRLRLRLQPVGRSGDLVLRSKDLSIGYADEGRPLFAVPDLVLRRGECAAILGPNGAGKTTFLKTLLEQVPPYEGEVMPGASLRIGYFAQAHEGLHPDWTLMEEIQAVNPKMLPAEARDYLAQFLFSGEDVFKQVHMLSGGERGRLALACLALQGANLLLLDEPTNHLDLPSQEVLQSILGEFGGTILLVTHDRYLVDALASQIWEVERDKGRLTVFAGAYSEYKTWRQAETARLATQGGDEKTAAVRAAPARPAGRSSNEARKRQRQQQALESEIARIEEQMTALSQALENPPADPAEVHRLGEEYVRLEARLNKALGEWGELQEQSL